jgi:hypothetical protein
MFNDNAAIIHWIAELEADGFTSDEVMAFIAHAVAHHYFKVREQHKVQSVYSIYDSLEIAFDCYLAEHIWEMTGEHPHSCVKLPKNGVSLIEWRDKKGR